MRPAAPRDGGAKGAAAGQGGRSNLVYRAGLLTIEGDGVQGWFAARHPEKMDVMKVRATWMQFNIINVQCTLAC